MKQIILNLLRLKVRSATSNALFQWLGKSTICTMPKYIDPKTLVGKPMVLKSITTGEATVMIGDLRAGRIMEQVKAGQKHVYFWTLTSPYTVAAVISASGDAETLDDAKTALRVAFDAWLKWALQQERPVVWYG